MYACMYRGGKLSKSGGAIVWEVNCPGVNCLGVNCPFPRPPLRRKHPVTGGVHGPNGADLTVH